MSIRWAGSTQADLDAFAAMYASAPRPVLAYCRTGMRAEALWQGSRAPGEGVG